jgi:hypothetical protein
MMDINIIYLISNSNIQDNKIINAKRLEKNIIDEHELYNEYFNIIIDKILEKNFSSNINLKDELLSYKNIIQEINKKIYTIYIENMLLDREITEIDSLKILNDELYNILIDCKNKNNIIIVDYKLVKFIKVLISKEKIYKKIYFVTDFNKPILYMIKEYIAIMSTNN